MFNIKEDHHVHTNFNDHSPIDLSVANVIKYGEEKGLISIAFTEHVRKNSVILTAESTVVTGAWTGPNAKSLVLILK